ncbi:MAG: hypothetical protein AAGF11_28605 [Myxococcota bacterium]
MLPLLFNLLFVVLAPGQSATSSSPPPGHLFTLHADHFLLRGYMAYFYIHDHRDKDDSSRAQLTFECRIYELDEYARPARYRKEVSTERSIQQLMGQPCIAIKLRQRPIVHFCGEHLTPHGGPISLRFQLDEARARFTDEKTMILTHNGTHWTMLDRKNNPIRDIAMITSTLPPNIVDLRFR